MLDPGSIAAWVSAVLAGLLVVERVFVRARDDTATWRRRIEEKLDAAGLAIVRIEGRLTTVEAGVGMLHEQARKATERSAETGARLAVLEAEAGLSSGPVGRR